MNGLIISDLKSKRPVKILLKRCSKRLGIVFVKRIAYFSLIFMKLQY